MRSNGKLAQTFSWMNNLKVGTQKGKRVFMTSHQSLPCKDNISTALSGSFPKIWHKIFNGPEQKCGQKKQIKNSTSALLGLDDIGHEAFLAVIPRHNSEAPWALSSTSPLLVLLILNFVCLLVRHVPKLLVSHYMRYMNVVMDEHCNIMGAQNHTTVRCESSFIAERLIYNEFGVHRENNKPLLLSLTHFSRYKRYKRTWAPILWYWPLVLGYDLTLAGSLFFTLRKLAIDFSLLFRFSFFFSFSF